VHTACFKVGSLAAAVLIGSLVLGCDHGDKQTPKAAAKNNPPSDASSHPAATPVDAPPQPTAPSQAEKERLIAEAERRAEEAERKVWEQRIAEARQAEGAKQQADASHVRGGDSTESHVDTTKSPTTSFAPPLDPLPEKSAPKDDACGSTKPEHLPTANPSPPPTAGSTPGELVEQELPYEVVKVYYATDRATIDVADWQRSLRGGWPGLTALLGAVSLALLLFALRSHRRVAFRRLGWCSLAVAVLLGGLTLVYRVRPELAGHDVQRMYGNGRGELELGSCQVSIPKDHQVGQMESPSILRLEFHQDPERHIVLQDVRMEPTDDFYGDLRACVGRSAGRQAFVFIHGYNVGFETAARRTAQIAYDLKFDGAPIFYSWPSQEGLLSYTIDENNVAWTVPHLKEFLLGIAQRSGAQSIHLVAHSMGNRALTAALRELSLELKNDCPRFHEVVLTAPDIDADVFRRDLAPAIVNVADRVTLYASSNDEALAASKAIHGYRRAGDSGDRVVIVPGVDTIDVSDIDTSLIGHCYYGSNKTVLADLFELIHGSKPPDQRKWLRSMQLGVLTYWKFLREPVTIATPEMKEVR